MANTTQQRYADWKAPRGDGEILLWPASVDEIVRRTRENARSLAGSTGSLIQGVPLAQLRRDMRRFIGHNTDDLLIATGHQTELDHPGVWVKNVLINRIAEAAGGSAYLFAVDTDEPKHLTLKWPGGTPVSVTDDPRLGVAAWCGQVAPPTPAHLSMLEEQLDDAQRGWSFQPMAGEFLRSMRRVSLEAEALSPVLVNALHDLDWQLGLRHHALVVSPMFQAESYLLFVHHLMARADEVAAHYNGALADYRREQRIKTVGRPMPDLKLASDRVESPFWVDDLTSGDRQRAALIRTAGGWSLPSASSTEPFLFETGAKSEDAARNLLTWLRRNNLRISPRALTLTTFLRLFLVDQFVHGIGGGRYDQVADRFIASQFGIAPPCFAVTTATLYFPSAVGRERLCMPCLAQEGHSLKHAALGDQKRNYLDKIGVLPRRSIQRREVFQEMHHQLKERGADSWRQWESKVRDLQSRQVEEDALFDRELFYGLQSRRRLEMMISKYQVAGG